MWSLLWQARWGVLLICCMTYQEVTGGIGIGAPKMMIIVVIPSTEHIMPNFSISMAEADQSYVEGPSCRRVGIFQN